MPDVQLDFNGLPCRQYEKQNLGVRMMVNLKVKVDPDRPGISIPDESDKIDLYALIQTYKDQCGMIAMQRSLQLGQALPEDFADDGKHGVDATELPGSSQELENLRILAGNNVDAIKSKFGIPSGEFSDEQLTKIIQDKVAEVLKDQIKVAEAPAPAGGNE